jgi:N-acyl-L-homoserine lactone synthetase
VATIVSQPEQLMPEVLAPPVETNVFLPCPEATFWLGKTATGTDIHLKNEYVSSLILRANVYIDEHGYLTADKRNHDGTESDDHDLNSIHFAAIQNHTGDETLKKLVGNARLIHKNADENLPVEALFPEAFVDKPVPVNSMEASRFISRHPNRLSQNIISLGLIRGMVYESVSRDAQYVYAVVEDHLVRLFNKIGLPMDQLSTAKNLAEYNDSPNMAVRFEPTVILETAHEDTGGERMMSAFFKTHPERFGLGLFDEYLMNSLEPVDR